MPRLTFAWVFLGALVSCTISPKDEGLIQHVDPFIGTGGHGHTYPGATAPFGMVQLSPDTRLEGWDGCSGYHYTDSIIYGFSHTHLSGTGVADYCDILFKPYLGDIQWENGYESQVGYQSAFNKADEFASLGAYSVFLEEGIQVDLTAGKRSGFHSYDFQSDEEARVILDLEHRDRLLGSEIEIINDSTIAGFRRSSSWAADQMVYFYAVFNQKWSKEQWHTNAQSEEITKANFLFDVEGERLLLKVGISAVDVEGARRNLGSDIPSWDFELRRKETEELWEDQLAKISIEGDSKDQIIFYTALYHSMLAPNLYSDVDGRYRKALPKESSQDEKGIGKLNEGDQHYTIFSLWDTYRATHPLYTLIERKRTQEFIGTFLRQYREGGQLPVWELAGNFTGCMIGYHSVSVIADAYLKGIRGFDEGLALEAMRHSAEQDHLGLEAYKKRGFIGSEDESESVSKTLEYAYDDWCIAQMAKEMDSLDTYERYCKRAQSYKNLFDPESNFVRARGNGGWYSPFYPTEVNFNYTEANGWQYSLSMPHDVNGYKALIGGDEKLEVHLDSLFETNPALLGRHQSDITGLIGQYAHGNEPSHHMAFMYNHSSAPWKTQKYVLRILNEMYSIETDGLSGNEDCGQMSSWYVLASMGLYPMLPGSPNYELSTPFRPKSVIRLEKGKECIIRKEGEGGYIQKVLWNGRELDRLYVHHDDLMQGGELLFYVGDKPKREGFNQSDYSGIDEHLIIPVPYIKSDAPSFKDSLMIEIASVSGDIRYRLNSSDSFRAYEGAFWIDQSVELEAYAEAEENRSAMVEAKFNRLDRNWRLKLKSGYASQYSASGDDALIDGLRGGRDFRTGNWQGYQEVNLLLDLEFEEARTIEKVSLSCLQDIRSWIWFPSEVEFIFFNSDGRELKRTTVENRFPDNEYGSFIKELSVFEELNDVKQVEVKAVNYGRCPDWHLGTGGKAWIFVDELLVE